MWNIGNGKIGSNNNINLGRKGGRNGLIALAMDKDKGSQYALKWTIENLLTKGQTLILIHVLPPSSSNNNGVNNGYVNGGASPMNNAMKALEKQTNDLFLTFHCFCTRKDINCLDVVLEDTDISKGITEYVAQAGIESLVLGASRHGFIRKLKMADVPTSVSRDSPDFCTVYVITKTKLSSVKNASRMAPFSSPLVSQIQQRQQESQATSTINLNSLDAIPRHMQSYPDAIPKHMQSMRGAERTPPRKSVPDDTDSVRSSPLGRGRGQNGNLFGDISESDSDISFISSDRPSTDRRSTDSRSTNPMSGMYFFDGADSSCRTSRVSATSSDSSFGSIRSNAKWSQMSSFTDCSSASVENDDVEAEMRRLKLELQKTMDMYSTACKEALTAKQKAVELHRWRMEEERRLEETRQAEEAARLSAEQERAKYKAAMENARERLISVENDSQNRVESELEENDKSAMMSMTPLRYRKYSIDEIEEATEYFSASRKIGEGGYGPVYKCSLDHTPVAIKVLRPDAAQGRSQFQQEVEVLSCMRHPNMVLLLGACPEYGCLVYEYLSNGSLEDRLFRRGNTRPLSWQLRFRIASEIATGLNFLHQTKPEPLVHRDLKPGNILLDQNYVCKISDVGLARLVPPNVADDVTQYRMTSAAGTFCYIDPEYQQTGMLGVKSDVYSFGIVLLQILTAKPAMGLTHYIGRAMETGTLAEMLDPCVPDWPMEEATAFAKLGLQCAELRRKDRPDLGKIVLPELNRLRDVGEENMNSFLIGSSTTAPSPNRSFNSTKQIQEVKSDSQAVPSELIDTNPCPGSASLPEKLSAETTE